MTSTIAVLSGWLLFGGAHLAISSSRLRPWLVTRLGPARFTVLFAGIAAASLSLLIALVVVYGDSGLPGAGLGQVEAVRWLLGGLSILGMVLILAGLANFGATPMAVLGRRQRGSAEKDRTPLAPPTALERVARHPFFLGLILVMGAHALLAETVATAVFFAGFVAMAGFGMVLQDRKLAARWGSVYQAHMDATPAVLRVTPSVRRGQQNRQWGLLGGSLVAAVVLFVGFHGFWAMGNGAMFAVFVGLFGTAAVIWAVRPSRRNR